MQLTQKTVDTALYEGRSHMSKGGRKRWSRHVLWDEALPGFGLRISPTQRKSFIVTYRAKGRKRTKTLGTAARLKLDEARRLAGEFLESIAEEEPAPAAATSAIEGVETVAQLADTYLERHLKSTVPSWYADQRLIRTHIKPAIGRSPVDEVSPNDLANFAGRIGRRFPADARRLRSLLEGMFSWAREQGLRTGPAASKETGADPSAGPDEPPGEGLPEAEGGAAAAPPPEDRSATASRQEPEPQAARPPTAEEAMESLARSEDRRRELAAQLDEVSTSGGEMLAKLNEQAAAHKTLEAELAESRRQLEQARAEAAERLDPARVEKETGNLRQSVEQLMASQTEARRERDEIADKLANLEARASRQAKRLADMTRSRNELEDRLREEERKAAIRRVQSRRGNRRLQTAGWLLAGLIAGVLATLVGQAVLGRAAETGGAAPTDRLAAGADDERPESSAIEPRPAAGPDPPAAPGGPAAVGDAPEPDYAAAEAAVRSWAAAWSEKRAGDYLAAYSARYQPPDGLGRGEWESRRRNRIRRPAMIQVTLGAMSRTALGPDRVRLSFVQGYETPTYSDTVVKTLELALEPGGWKIVAEESN